MPAPVTTDTVWKAVEANVFGVLAFVNPAGEARSAGVVYTVRDRMFYITTGCDTWKARHITVNPNVSLTITIPKHIPFMPFVKVPSAVATCQGKAAVVSVHDVDREILERLYRGLELTDERLADSCVLVIEPTGDFVTYGIGVPLIRMREPEMAIGRAPVGARTTLPPGSPHPEPT